MARRNVARILVAAAALGACNGDDDVARTTVPITSDDAASTTAPPTTSEPTDMTTVPTTVEPATEMTTATTAPPPTTGETPATTDPAPSTTTEPDVDEAVQARFDVLDAVERSFQASLVVRREPLDDAKIDALQDHYTGVQLDGWRRIVDRFRDRNLRLLVNPDEADAAQVELASLAVNRDLDAATVQVCEVLAGILVEIGGNDDGTDRVINDDITRTVVELEIVVADGVWKISSAREPAENERIASCQ